jgi:uncharacterized membrane protein HdeD (DUF308 family)
MEKAMSRSAVYLGVSGVASIVFGAIALLLPGITLVVLTLLFGVFAVVSGFLALASALNLLAHRSTEWVPNLLGGVAGVLIGGAALLYPGLTDLALVYLIAGFAIVVGGFELIGSLQLRGAISGAGWLAAAGVLSVVFGLLIATAQPATGALAIVWLIGIYAILTGASRLFGAYHTYRSEHAKRAFTRTQTES